MLNPIVGIISCSVFYMIFMPFGTFDYKEYGFYLCILGAVIMELVLKWFFKKYQKDYMSKLK